MRSRICLFGIIILFASCKSGDKKSEEQKEAVQQTESNEGTEITKWISNPGLKDWFQQLEQKDSSFKETAFTKINEDSLHLITAAQQMADKEWNIYQPYFVYSPDHSLAIDLYSYGTLPHHKPDGSVTLVSGEADNEISLINVENRMKERLLFSGPGTTYQQAAWEGDSVIIITGMSDANMSNKMLPVVWRINLSDSTIQIYNYIPEKDSLNIPDVK